MSSGRKWWIFCWGESFAGLPDGPRYYGIYWGGLQIGYWERPSTYAMRLEKAKASRI